MDKLILGRPIKIAILGYGGRGKMYAQVCKRMSRLYDVVAIIDNSAVKLGVAKNEHSGVAVYGSLDDFLTQPKVCDYLFVCTQDSDHHEHALKALKAGYDLLLEKPIANTPEDCVDICDIAVKLGRQVIVCHVLRYSEYYHKIKKVMDSGVLGRIIAIEQIENVGYWHQAHSYVRGDWRIAAESNPMILAKCCHDLDIAVYLAASECDYVTSVGKLTYFNKENAPDGATEYCLKGCKAKSSCPYDCEKLYVDSIKNRLGKAYSGSWPQSRLIADGIVTKVKLYDALNNTRYGKCVFLSDNDVVDYMATSMVFKNGIISTLTMTAFSNKSYRETRIRGSLGELICNMENNSYELRLFGKKAKKLKIFGAMDAHGGGDIGLVKGLASGEILSDIKMSVESHLIGFAAEKSRVNNGMAVKIDDYKALLKK